MDDKILQNQWWSYSEGTFTFIFTLAQAGRLSLQLLWTEALQSGKKRIHEYYEHDGGGRGGVKGVWKGGG